MKTTFIFLGLVALSFTNNSNAANGFRSQDIFQQEESVIIVDTAKQKDQLVFVDQELSKNFIVTNMDKTTFFDHNNVIKTSYRKTTEEIITENKLITESDEETVQPLSLDKTIEDSIIEDNKIIDSKVSNEIFPLDFVKINSSLKKDKTSDNLTVISDLKL